MISVIKRVGKNGLAKIYLYDNNNPKKFIMLSLLNSKMKIMVGTIETYEPTRKSNLRPVLFNIPGEIPEEIYGEIPSEIYEDNPLYFALLKLFRAIRGERIYSDNRIIHGQNCLEIVPTVDGFSIIAYIDLLINYFSENQMHLEISLYQNDHLSSALIEFYNALDSISEKNTYTNAILSALFNLMNIVKKEYVDYPPYQKGKDKEYIKQKQANVMDNKKRKAA